MKTFLKIFNWLSLSSSDAVKNSIESCQTRQRHGNDTATTRQRVLTAGLSYRKIAILTLLLSIGVGQMWANTYYYSGQGNGTNWSKEAMTVSDDGFYEYYYVSTTTTHQFKIGTSSNQYAYNYTYVQSGFNSTNVTQIGDYSSNNCYCWKGSAHYILVYYPNTIINTSSNPKICASTTKPEQTSLKIKHSWDGTSWTWQTMSRTGSATYTYTGNCYTANGANVWTSTSDQNYLSPSGTSGVNNGVPAVWTYNSTANTLSVAPAYTLTVQADGHGSASGSVSKGIKMSTKYAISASSPSTGYHFNNWTRVSGGTCTFDNSSSASTNVTVTGDASATVRANFALNTYTVAYNANDDQYPGTASGSTTSSSHTYGTAKNLTSNGFSRTGYIFAGWATTPTGDVAYTNGQSVTNLSSTQGATVTLYAKWVPTWQLYDKSSGSQVSMGAFTKGEGTYEYTLLVNLANTSQISFKKDGSSWYYTGADNPTSMNVSLISGTGVEAVQWNNTGNAAGSYTLTINSADGSSWYYRAVSAASYSVTYNTTGSTSGSAPTDATSYADGASVTVKGNTGSLVKTGYEFVGWTDNSSGTGTVYTAGDTYTISSADVNFYPKWRQLTTVTINVSPAGAGTLTLDAAAFTAGNTTTAGVTTSHTVVATAANDYAFSSWSVTGNATGTNSTNTYTLKGNGSGSTGTLTANFTLVDCKLMKLSAAKNGSETDKGSMSYDATEHAYYKEITTDASPYYFRFTHNGSTKFCSDWKDKYDGGYTSGKEISANGSKIDCDQSVGGWGDKPAMYYSGESGTTIRIWFDYQNKKVWITADKDKQYVLRGANADNSSLTHGMPGWSATDSYFVGLASGNTGTISCTLNAAEWYHAKVYDLYTKTWYGPSSDTELEDGTLTVAPANGGGDFYFGTTIAGSYTFTFDKSSGTKVKVDYPISYTVTYGVGTSYTSMGSVSTSPSITSGTYVASGTEITFTATPNLGYKFVGWYNNSGCTGDAVSTNAAYTVASLSAATTLYAKFEVRNLYIHADFISNWATPALMTQSTANRAVYTYTINNMEVLASAQVGDAWNTGYHFHFVNAVADPNNNKAYNYNGVQTPTYSGSSIDGVHKTHNDNPTIEFGLTRKSNVTITLTLQSINDATKPTVNIAADPIYTITHGNPTHGSYTIKVGDASPVSTNTESVAETTITLAPTPATGYHFDSWTVTKAGGGTVTVTSNQFSMPSNDVTIAATFAPNTYTITFDGNGKTSGTMSNQTGVTYDAATTITANAFVKTGYTFAGWSTTKARADAGTIDRADGAAHGNLTSTNGATVTLYASWTPKQSALTLDYQTSATGYGSSGSISNTSGLKGTYDAAMTALTGTMPSGANGYAFMGFYDATGGGGTKYYNADGSSAHNWDKDTESGTTLYAYYKKAEITAITFDAATVEASGTVSFAVTVSPTPVEPTKLCFTVLHSNDNPLESQPTVTYNDGTGKYSFTAPEASGTYKVEAVLRTGTSCDGGTELDTEVANFQVAGTHTVTVQFKCGDEIIKASETVTGRPLDPTEITAPEIVGYAFSKWKAGDGITIEGADGNGETTSATINFTAIYDGKLTAIYTQKRFIYFYNTLNWENVYVYFYKDGNYWLNDKGTGTDPTYHGRSHAAAHKGQMLPVAEGSKIYYFDAEGASIPSGYTNVAFTEKQQDNCWYFYDNNKVSRRGDYSSSMPLFVPLSDQPEVKKNGNMASYYCEGYWMNYPANSGYTLRIYDGPYANNATGASREFMIPFSADTKMPLKQEVEVNFSGKSWFIIYRNDGTYLEGSHTFKQTDHGDKKITSNPDASKAKKMTLISDGSGIYTFTLTFRGDGGSPENYDYYINVDFPAAVGDYRIVYKDNATWTHGAHGNDYATWYHPSDIIGKNNSATETKEDTVSFFVSYGSSPAMKFQYISAINGSTGAITWTDVTSGAITIPASITEAGVYNFIVSQPAGGASISLEKAEPYTGNYYIRTDCAGETKWNNFRSHDHLMNYSEYSITHGGYSHYYCHWVQTDDRKNVKFCIANDYSPCISDTLTREAASGTWANIGTFIESNGDLKRNANVRFMWNRHDNTISRAYVDGAQGTGSNNFLYMLSEDNKIRKTDESALDDHKVFFSDNENWIYEANIQAQPKAAIKLLSNWGTSNTITQYFKGSSSTTETLIDGSGEDWYDIRLLYDFKTNRLVAAWVPSDQNITVDNPIHADVMFIREHQGDIAQLTFGESGKISKITTAYGVIRFNKWTLANKSKEAGHAPLGSPASIYERSLFWISFPFRVKLSEVFGFGTYGEHWAIQRYDGAARAAKGHFQENGSFWRWMNRSTEYLEPNQGYLLAIDLDLLDENSDVWGPNSRSEQIELYFPSYGTMPDITNASVTQNIPEHTCTINRAATEGLPDTKDPRTSYNRTIFDSHWNVMSVPTYVNTDDVSFANTTWTAKKPSFLYTWNADDNTITATSASGYTYHAMHAYMAQYAGGITWTASSGSPASIVARKTYEEQPKEVEFRLELQQNEKEIDRTFVVLSNDEEVSAGFQFGEDMTKEFNASKASIYTFIPNVATVAGNTLPMTNQTTTVPVGVDIKANGDYTFAMPDGTSGIGVTLIDNETGVRTNLGLMDYTVTLTAGTYDQRFVLEIPAISSTPTGVEEVTGDGLPVTGARKVLIDNKLYIIKGDKVYDARGAKVQ